MPFAENFQQIRDTRAELVNQGVSKYTTPVVKTYICT